MLNRARLVVLALALGVGALFQAGSNAETKDAKADPALERTRKQVRMLDDLYKSAIVLITEKYVHSDADLPAGTATGEPIVETNAPADLFEKEAIKQLLAGKSGHEQVVEKDKQRFLRSATPIPVVMNKCVMCHPHYAEVKKGQAIGALSYTLPIE